MAVLYVAQWECQIHNLLNAQPHLPVTIVTGLHQLHVECTSKALICKRSVQIFEVIIVHCELIWNHHRARDERSTNKRRRHFLDEKWE